MPALLFSFSPLPQEGGRELAPGCDLWLTAEKEGWAGVGHQPLAGGGESRRPEGVSNSQLSTLNSQLSTLNSQLLTLNS
jgi:hypothetical protein